jgi:hypothetical protein
MGGRSTGFGEEPGQSKGTEESSAFLKKKRAKNFYLLGVVATPLQIPPVNRSFLLFFKKEALAFRRRRGWRRL